MTLYIGIFEELLKIIIGHDIVIHLLINKLIVKYSSAEEIKLDYYFLCIPRIAPSYNNSGTMTILYRNYLNTLPLLLFLK